MLPVPIYTAGGGGRKYRAVSCLRKQHDGKDWASNHRQPPYDCVPAQRNQVLTNCLQEFSQNGEQETDKLYKTVAQQSDSNLDRQTSLFSRMHMGNLLNALLFDTPEQKKVHQRRLTHQ